MDDYLNDYDRVEILKKWWDQYGTPLIIGIVAGLVLVYAWQYWSKQQTNTSQEASIAYQRLINLDNPNSEDYKKQAQLVINNYPKTAYAMFSNFLLAKVLVNEQNYDEALTALDSVIKHSKDASFQQIARIRAARILLAQNKTSEALKILDKENDKHFAVFTNEVRGDIYQAEQNYPQAKKAYEKAMAADPESQIMQPLLRLKLNNVSQKIA